MAGPNTGQIAPGEEAAHENFNTPYAGPAVHDHVGYESLNQAFMQGASFGRGEDND